MPPKAKKPFSKAQLQKILAHNKNLAKAKAKSRPPARTGKRRRGNSSSDDSSDDSDDSDNSSDDSRGGRGRRRGRRGSSDSSSGRSESSVSLNVTSRVRRKNVNRFALKPKSKKELEDESTFWDALGVKEKSGSGSSGRRKGDDSDESFDEGEDSDDSDISWRSPSPKKKKKRRKRRKTAGSSDESFGSARSARSSQSDDDDDDENRKKEKRGSSSGNRSSPEDSDSDQEKPSRSSRKRSSASSDGGSSSGRSARSRRSRSSGGSSGSSSGSDSDSSSSSSSSPGAMSDSREVSGSDSSDREREEADNAYTAAYADAEKKVLKKLGPKVRGGNYHNDPRFISMMAKKGFGKTDTGGTGVGEKGGDAGGSGGKGKRGSTGGKGAKGSGKGGKKTKEELRLERDAEARAGLFVRREFVRKEQKISQAVKLEQAIEREQRVREEERQKEIEKMKKNEDEEMLVGGIGVMGSVGGITGKQQVDAADCLGPLSMAQLKKLTPAQALRRKREFDRLACRASCGTTITRSRLVEGRLTTEVSGGKDRSDVIDLTTKMGISGNYAAGIYVIKNLQSTPVAATAGSKSDVEKSKSSSKSSDGPKTDERGRFLDKSGRPVSPGKQGRLEALIALANRKAGIGESKHSGEGRKSVPSVISSSTPGNTPGNPPTISSSSQQNTPSSKETTTPSASAVNEVGWFGLYPPPVLSLNTRPDIHAVRRQCAVNRARRSKNKTRILPKHDKNPIIRSLNVRGKDGVIRKRTFVVNPSVASKVLDKTGEGGKNLVGKREVDRGGKETKK